ncbi:12113_t:CDS:1, partial [Cetraspora pellucida]
EIQLIYKNFKQQTDYSFLVWNETEPQNIILTPNLDSQQQSLQQQSPQEQFSQQQSSQQQSSTIVSANNDVDLDLYQQCETKVAELEYLAKHLREELS